jgi:hypothetical protein
MLDKVKRVVKPHTQARLDEIKRVWRPKMRAKDVAVAVNFKATGASIIGFFNRWAQELYPCVLEPPGGMNPRTKAERKAAKTPIIAPPQIKKDHNLNNPVPKMYLPAKPLIALSPLPPDFQHIDLLELNDKVCRWPTGSHKEITFCGCPVARGVYCEYHAAIATPVLTAKFGQKYKKI